MWRTAAPSIEPLRLHLENPQISLFELSYFLIGQYMSPSLYGSCNQPTNTTLSSFGPQRTWEKKKKKKKKKNHISVSRFFYGNWTQWNPVRSGIIRKTDIKIGRTQTGGTFVNHENNFRQYFYDGKAVTNLSKQGQLLRNNTYQLNVFRTNIYSCFFFHERM